jgi:protein disulfide-isomerase-like protein
MGGGGGRARGGGRGQQQQERPKENLYAKDSAVTNLRQGKFPGTDAKHVWLVEFYAPWCGHCRQMKPIWERLASELRGFVKVGAVNCETQKSVCGMEGVESYPTIKMKKGGVSTPYDGERDLSAMKTWALEKLPVNVVNLRRPESLTSFLEKDCADAKKAAADGVCLVFFSADTETPAWLKVLAHAKKGKVPVAEARARNEALGLPLDVSVFPTLIAACGGDVDRTITYDGEITQDMTPSAVTEWASSFEGGKKCKDAPKNPKTGMTLDASIDYSKMRVSKLRAILTAHGIPCSLCAEKGDFVKAIAEAAAAGGGRAKQEL